MAGCATIAGAAPARSEIYETPRYIVAVLFGSCATCPAYQVVLVDKQEKKSAVVVPEVLPDTGENAPGEFSTMSFAAEGFRFRVQRTFDTLEVTDSATGAAVRQKLVGHDAPMIGYDGKGSYFIVEMPAATPDRVARGSSSPARRKPNSSKAVKARTTIARSVSSIPAARPTRSRGSRRETASLTRRRYRVRRPPRGFSSSTSPRRCSPGAIKANMICERRQKRI